MSLVEIGGRAFRNSKCKGPGVRTNLACLRTSREAPCLSAGGASVMVNFMFQLVWAKGCPNRR